MAWLRYFWLILICLTGWLGVAVTRAQTTPSVVINEVMWAGSEYVELYNPTDDSVPLGGWKLLRQKPGADQEVITTIAVNKTIASKGYFVLAASGAVTSNVDADLPSSRLVDTGELLLLQDANG